MKLFKYFVEMKNSETHKIESYSGDYGSFSEAVAVAHMRRNSDGVNSWRIVSINEVNQAKEHSDEMKYIDLFDLNLVDTD